MEILLGKGDRRHSMSQLEPFNIAWANKGDATKLVPLLTALYKHDVPEAPEPTRDVVERHLALLLEPETPHRLAIVWTEESVAVGLAAVARFISISDPRPERWSQMELKELFVLPEYRSGGLGQALMNWIEAKAGTEGACRIDWHVKRDNERGIAFYERFGASVVENRLSMRKSLLK